MEHQQLEVADVFRTYWDSYAQKASVTPLQAKIARDIMSCRTAALGGHLYRCNDCGHTDQSYNSCRNRHCPKCQGTETAAWIDARRADLVSVPYFHTVFTLPDHFNQLALSNKKIVYEILFRAVRETLLTVGKNNLGVTLGFFAVLHTWGQLMQLHPHIHCVIPACGITDAGEVKVFNDKYLLSDRVLSSVFRGKCIGYLKAAYRKGSLRLPDSIPNSDSFEAYLTESCKADWVVYSKAPFAGPDVVVKYLARYTHRVAIGNSRLVSMTDDRVSFRYRDYADESKEKVTSLAATEFIRRFMLHTVPKGFVRIRHCGFLCHSKKKAALILIRSAVTPKPAIKADVPNPHSFHACPCCGSLSWVRAEKIPMFVYPLAQAPPSNPPDSLAS